MIALMPHGGFLSETSRMLHIARALQAQGESVVVASHGGPYTRVLDEAGMPWTLLEPAMDEVRCQQYLRDLLQIGRPGVRLQPLEEVRRSVAAEAAFLRERGADMVVIGFTLTAYLSSRVVNIPLAASHGGSYVPPVFERGLLPAPTTMPIRRAEWLPVWLKRKMVNSAARRLTEPMRFLNDIATELGVEPVPTAAALMLGDLTLVTDVPQVLGVSQADLEAWRPRCAAYRPGTRLVYTGPLFAKLDTAIPPHVQSFLDGRQPTAYVVLSSSTPDMLRAVVGRVRAAGPRVIVGATIHDFGPVDDRGIVVAGILPSHEIMPRVDVIVSMGGQGTVQTAMSSGVPLVGIPLHGEQELNVDLAVRQGMGLAIARRHADTAHMTSAVQRILQEPLFRQQARRVQGFYAGVDGAARAAQALRGHLAGLQAPHAAAA